MIRAGSGFSSITNVFRALEEAVGNAMVKCPNPQLFFVFSSSNYDPRLISEFFSSEFKNSWFIGTSSSGVITETEESEWRKNSISLLALEALPFVPFSIWTGNKDPEEIGRNLGIRLEKSASTSSSLVVLTTPMVDIQSVIDGVSKVLNIPIVGGLSSALPNDPLFVFSNDSLGSYNICGVLMSVDVDISVFQTCRNVGDIYTITKVEGNAIEEIEGLSAFQIFQDTIRSVTSISPEFANVPWLVGVEVGEDIFRYTGIIGVNSGQIFTAQPIPTGSRICFATISKESAQMNSFSELYHLKKKKGEFGLFFNCIARGRNLYGVQNYDISTIVSCTGNIPIAGFFTNGEIAKVSDKNFLFYYTGVFALFYL